MPPLPSPAVHHPSSTPSQEDHYPWSKAMPRSKSPFSITHVSQSGLGVQIGFSFSPFFFNWKEALNTLKVASGTSSQHALHLLLLRQTSLQPLCKLCFQLQKLVWTRSVTEAVQTGFCNWKGGKTKDFQPSKAKIGRSWSDSCGTQMAVPSMGTGASPEESWALGLKITG